MESKLSLENILKLINLYRSHSLLWDMNSKSYRRNDLKNKAYELIAKEMGMMVEVVKKKIRNLRTTYTNEKRKISCKKSGSGAEEQYMTSLPWYSEMSFLDNSIFIRKTMDNLAEEQIYATCGGPQQKPATSSGTETIYDDDVSADILEVLEENEAIEVLQEGEAIEVLEEREYIEVLEEPSPSIKRVLWVKHTPTSLKTPTTQTLKTEKPIKKAAKNKLWSKVAQKKLEKIELEIEFMKEEHKLKMEKLRLEIKTLKD